MRSPGCLLVSIAVLLNAIRTQASSESITDGGNVTIDTLGALSNRGEFSVLYALIQSQNLPQRVDSSNKALTLLAPTNFAFSLVSSQELAQLNETNRLSTVLLYHFLVGYYNFSTLLTLKNGTNIDTLAGISLPLNVGDGRVVVKTPDASYQITTANGDTVPLGEQGRTGVVDQPDVFLNGSLAIEGINVVLIPPDVTSITAETSPPVQESPSNQSPTATTESSTPEGNSNGETASPPTENAAGIMWVSPISFGLALGLSLSLQMKLI